MLVHHNKHFHIFIRTEMQLKTILHSVTDYKSFVFTNVWQEDENSESRWIGAEIVPRKNSLGILQELLGYNLRIVRAYLMKEEFERFWQYKSPYWAGRFLHDWCVRAMRSRIEPMRKFVGTIRSHRE